MPESSTFSEVIKYAVSTLLGGLATAATALPYFHNKLTKLETEVSDMKSDCTTCKSGFERALERLLDNVADHHQDDAKHNNPYSAQLLTDILARVSRIEAHLIVHPLREPNPK